MSRKSYYFRARLDDALENAVVNRQIVHDCERSEAGRQLMRLGADLKASAPVIRPAWADKSLAAIDELLKASGQNIKSVKSLKELAAGGLAGDLGRRQKVGTLVDHTYEIHQKLESLHLTLLGLDPGEVETLQTHKPVLEARAAQGDAASASMLKLVNNLGI